jgi:hypothetical protein
MGKHRAGACHEAKEETVSMTDAEDTIQTLRRLVIDTKDELMHARYRLNGLDLILKGLADERAMSASQEIFGLPTRSWMRSTTSSTRFTGAVGARAGGPGG